MGDDCRGGDALRFPHGLDDVGLLAKRVRVVGRLVRRAEAEEVEREQLEALGERGRDLRPVVRAAREAVQERHVRRGITPAPDEDVAL